MAKKTAKKSGGKAKITATRKGAAVGGKFKAVPTFRIPQKIQKGLFTKANGMPLQKFVAQELGKIAGV
jgi:hypothetical protein